jgi:hypothetical protein
MNKEYTSKHSFFSLIVLFGALFRWGLRPNEKKDPQEHSYQTFSLSI